MAKPKRKKQEKKLPECYTGPCLIKYVPLLAKLAGGKT